MQLLLVAEEQVAPGETALALWTLKWLLLRVRSLMSLQMLQPGEGTAASGTTMRTRLISLWRREVCSRSLRVDSDGGSLYSCGSYRLANDTKATFAGS